MIIHNECGCKLVESPGSYPICSAEQLDCALKQLGEYYSILRALTYSWEYNTIAMLKIGFIFDFYSILLQNVMDHDIHVIISYPKFLFSRM